MLWLSYRSDVSPHFIINTTITVQQQLVSKILTFVSVSLLLHLESHLLGLKLDPVGPVRSSWVLVAIWTKFHTQFYSSRAVIDTSGLYKVAKEVAEKYSWELV